MSKPVRGPDADVGAAINAEHHAAQAARESFIAHAVKCGQLLIAQKAAIKGKFVAWVDAHCDFKYQTAADYMRAAEAVSRGLEITSLADMKRKLGKHREDFETPDSELHKTITERILEKVVAALHDVDPLQTMRDTTTDEELERIEAHAARIQSVVIQLCEAAVRKRLGLPEAPYDRETATTKLWSEGRGLNS